MRCLLPAVFLIVLPACGRTILYHPTALSPERYERLSTTDGWEPLSLPLDENGRETLRGVVRPSQSGDSRWLIYFGGNAQGLSSAVSTIETLTRSQPMQAAACAYRGYDGSAGDPTQDGLVSDGVKLVEHLVATGKANYGDIVVVGFSLGTGVASQVAAKLSQSAKAPGALVLLAPFTSIPDVASDKVLGLPVGGIFQDKFESDEALRSVHCPMLIVHGNKDEVIPVEHGRALAEQTHAHYVEIDGAGHNNLINTKTREAVAAFLQSLKATPPPAQSAAQ